MIVDEKGRYDKQSALVGSINYTNAKYDKTFRMLAGQEIRNEVHLDLSDIELIHADNILKFGGSDGVRDWNLLESVAEAPYREFFGMKEFPEIVDKAAKYAFDFANYQIFVDGNKRTGMALAYAFLSLNGFTLDYSPTEAYQVTMDIATKKLDSPEAVSAEFKEHLRTQIEYANVSYMDIDGNPIDINEEREDI